MRIMYTTKPDDTCRETDQPGIYGRATHSYEQPALQSQGWVYDPAELQGKDTRPTPKPEQPEIEGLMPEVDPVPRETDDDDAEYELWAGKFKEIYGKRPHHNMRLDTIREKVQSHDSETGDSGAGA